MIHFFLLNLFFETMQELIKRITSTFDEWDCFMMSLIFVSLLEKPLTNLEKNRNGLSVFGRINISMRYCYVAVHNEEALSRIVLIIAWGKINLHWIIHKHRINKRPLITYREWIGLKGSVWNNIVALLAIRIIQCFKIFYHCATVLIIWSATVLIIWSATVLIFWSATVVII